MSNRPLTVPGASTITPPFLDDAVVILSPEGKELWRISIVGAFLSSKYRNALAISESKWDPLHANSVKVVKSDVTAAHPYAKAGQILIAMRNNDIIALIDPELETIAWAIRGPWRGQHDPDFLNNGNMLVFDNQGHIGPGGRSRVIEFDPLTLKIQWSYAGNEDDLFFSVRRSRQQPLPNGNILVTESDGGRIFEVTREREIVWEYISPHRGGEDEKYVAAILDGQRIARSALPFLDQ